MTTFDVTEKQEAPLDTTLRGSTLTYELLNVFFYKPAFYRRLDTHLATYMTGGFNDPHHVCCNGYIPKQ
jgi:hypothetical protein